MKYVVGEITQKMRAGNAAGTEILMTHLQTGERSYQDIIQAIND